MAATTSGRLSLGPQVAQATAAAGLATERRFQQSRSTTSCPLFPQRLQRNLCLESRREAPPLRHLRPSGSVVGVHLNALSEKPGPPQLN